MRTVGFWSELNGRRWAEELHGSFSNLVLWYYDNYGIILPYHTKSLRFCLHSIVCGTYQVDINYNQSQSHSFGWVILATRFHFVIKWSLEFPKFRSYRVSQIPLVSLKLIYMSCTAVLCCPYSNRPSPVFLSPHLSVARFQLPPFSLARSSLVRLSGIAQLRQPTRRK